MEEKLIWKANLKVWQGFTKIILIENNLTSLFDTGLNNVWVWNYEICTIIEELEVKGTLRIIEFQTFCYRQGHLQLDQVAWSSIQPSLEHFQGQGIHSTSPLLEKNFFLIFNTKLRTFSLKPLLLFLLLHHLTKSLNGCAYSYIK